MAMKPRLQQAIKKYNRFATRSGIQPPSKNFTMLAATNDPSTVTKSPAASRLDGRLHLQISRMARYIRTLVNSIVKETAMPNAAARLADERKTMVSNKVRAIVPN